MTIPHPRATVPSWLTLLLAAACGLVVANLYYAQPLVGPIAADLGIAPGSAGLVVTLTQLGYGAGLLLVVPLGDRIENKRLITGVLAVCVCALAATAFARAALPFLAAALFVGLGSVAVQILVPYAAHLAPETVRGRVVGNVMSGLMLGIMLARPVASFVTALLGWHAVFVISAGVVTLLAVLLWRVLPERRPTPGMAYGALLRSMGTLLRTTPVLRRRAGYHFFLFAGFSLFWTAVPLLLAGPVYGYGQHGIALFALAGVAGAIAAPIAGRLADAGHGKAGTGLAMLTVAASFALSWLGLHGGLAGLAALLAAAVLIDFGVTANLVFGQRAIFALPAEIRSRLNGLYMSIFFMGGAGGSALGAWAYAHGGWALAAASGAALALAALAYYATER